MLQAQGTDGMKLDWNYLSFMGTRTSRYREFQLALQEPRNTVIV